LKAPPAGPSHPYTQTLSCSLQKIMQSKKHEDREKHLDFLKITGDAKFESAIE